MPRRFLPIVFLVVAFSLNVSAQTQLAGWTFDTTPAAPNTPNSITANLGSQSANAVLSADGNNGSSSWTAATELAAFAGSTTNDPRGAGAVAGQTLSFVNSSANGKSIVLKFSTAGFENPILSFATRGTSTGFNNHSWAWSTDGSNFTDFGSNTAITTATFITQTLDLSSINSVDNANTVYLRLTVSGATTASGNNRFDNILINATALPVPEPPEFPRGYPNIFNFTTSGFDLKFKLNETGKVYYVFLPKDDATPTSLQVKEGKDGNDNLVTSELFGSINITSTSLEFVSVINTLNPATEYDVYIVGEDDVGNLQANPWKLIAYTNAVGDVTPPSFTANYPTVPAITSFGFNIYTALNEWGTVYFVILGHDVSAPTAQQVKQGKDAAGNSLNEEMFGSTIINRVNDAFLDKIDELTPETIYDVYLVAEDNVPNIQLEPLKLTITTKPLFEERFEECERNSFTAFSVSGDQTWSCVDFGRASKGYRMNGFSGTAVINEDWLISPPIQVGTNAELSFYSQFSFAGNGLQLKISTNYSGEGNPAVATWNDLNGHFPTASVPSNSSSLSDWTLSEVDLSTYADQTVYIAYVYTSTAAAAARWTIDDVNITNSTAGYLSLSASALNFTAAGSVKSYILKGVHLQNSIQLTSTGSFSISKDNSSFSSSISFTAEESAANPSVYVKFNPDGPAADTYTGAIAHTSHGAASRTISLIGTDKTKTFDVTAYNLEFFGTDVHGTDGSEFGPTDDALQVGNAITVFQTIQSDIFSVEEVSDDNAMNQLVSGLPGYNKVMADRWSYSFNAPDPNFPPQKIGFVYNTSTVNVVSSRVMFGKLFDDIRAGNVTLPGYPVASSSFWSSGRLPFMATIDVTINDKVSRVKMISLHSKSGSAQEDYDRRKYDVKVLYDSLIANYPNDKIIILGDFNDDVEESINTGHESTYKVFVDDQSNFKVLTYDLSQNGGYTFPSSSSFLDHIIISNELFDDYAANSILIEDPRNYISNYSNTTSDHLPVSARFSFKADQTITFALISPKAYTNEPFDLGAISSSGLPVSYTSSDPSVLSVEENIATIHKVGSVTITVSQAGDAATSPALDVVVELVITKATQAITFTLNSPRTFGDTPFELTASTSSKLDITYESSDSDVVGLDGNTATIRKGGTVTITASQQGSDLYESAEDVSVELVINKADQHVTFERIEGKTTDDNPLALVATATSGLPIIFTSSSDKVSIEGNAAMLIKPGRATIIAKQAGNDSYREAFASQYFCIYPAKPSITVSNSSGSPILISSSAIGNQWYLNDEAIESETNSTYSPASSGIFKVQVKVDDCVSDFSDGANVIVTGLTERTQISHYPNPATDYLVLSGIKIDAAIGITDMNGRSIHLSVEKMDDEKLKVDVQTLSKGIYVLRITDDQTIHQIRFAKN